MVRSIRAVHTIMGKRRTLTYELSDGTIVTAREVAQALGVTESAARNRLKDTRIELKYLNRTTEQKAASLEEDNLKQKNCYLTKTKC